MKTTSAAFWLAAAAAVALAVAACLSGCSGLPHSKSSTTDAKAAGNATAEHQTTLRRATAGTPPPNITITIGKGGTVTMPPPAAAVPMTPAREELEFSDAAGLSSDSSSSLDTLNKTVIPWGIRLLLVAAGVFALLLVVRYARRSSPAVDAILATADAALAARIREHRESAMAATDPAVIASHTQRIASLEAERGKLAKSKR